MPSMSPYVSTLLLLVLCTAGYALYRFFNPPDRGDLQASIEAEVLKFDASVNGYAVVVAVHKAGKTVFNGYGKVGPGNRTTPNETTVFQIGSLTKVFTGTLTQLLCDEGVVTLDTTLQELLGETLTLSSAAQEVTLRQLATHTSGFPSIPKAIGDKIIARAGPDNAMVDPYSHITRQDIFEYLATTPDKKAPGVFAYSNYGMGLLGHVLEQRLQRTYAELVSDRILAPLGMHGTALHLSDAMHDRLAQGYTLKAQPNPIWTMMALEGAGGLSATAQDMMHFAMANLGDGTPLSRAMRKAQAPQGKGRTGLGWMRATPIDRIFGNEDWVWHNGMTGGYASYLGIDTKNQSVVLVLTSKARETLMLGVALSRQVRTQSWAGQRIAQG